MGIEAEFVAHVDGERVTPETFWGVPGAFITLPLGTHGATNPQLPTGGAVYFVGPGPTTTWDGRAGGARCCRSCWAGPSTAGGRWPRTPAGRPGVSTSTSPSAITNGNFTRSGLRAKRGAPPGEVPLRRAWGRSRPRIDGVSHAPVGMRGWYHAAFRDAAGAERLLSIDDLLDRDADWE